jgi:ElaA protein
MKHEIQWTAKHFEELTALEYHHIIALRISIFIVEQDCPYQDADHKDLHSYHVYGTIDDKVAAVIRIISPSISYAEISIGRVAVVQEYRGTNVGNDLMTTSIDFITDTLGKQDIRISAQEHLKSFYHRFDFKQVSEMYLEDDIPHIEMLRKATLSPI